MEEFKVIAFTHKTLPLELIGKLHLTEEDQTVVLGALKLNFGFDELLYLGTCNRTELFIVSSRDVTRDMIFEIAVFLNSRLSNGEASTLKALAELFTGTEAVEHVLRVASSLESMVIGEREIISQVRKAYEKSNSAGLTGDFIRLLIKQTVETAKEIYTDTSIARSPVSVVSLAFRQLRNLGIKNDARVVFVGSGETNVALASYFKKHKLRNFVVFNRSLEKAERLAGSLNGKAYNLRELDKYNGGFDVLVVCTSSPEPIIGEVNFKHLCGGETSRKTIIDLAVPANVEQIVARKRQVNYIDITSLKETADANMKLRKKEMQKCELIIRKRAEGFNALHHERKVELAFGEVPKRVKAIKDLAVNEVFAKEISTMDPGSREVLDKVISYMEKKYNTVAIKTAKDVLLKNNMGKA